MVSPLIREKLILRNLAVSLSFLNLDEMQIKIKTEILMSSKHINEKRMGHAAPSAT